MFFNPADMAALANEGTSLQHTSENKSSCCCSGIFSRLGSCVTSCLRECGIWCREISLPSRYDWDSRTRHSEATSNILNTDTASASEARADLSASSL